MFAQLYADEKDNCNFKFEIVKVCVQLKATERNVFGY